MGKRAVLILFVISIFIISLSLISAVETKLLCLDNGDTVEFSKCNSLIPDRTCQSDMGCQYCVSEISSGVYCPKNINECNSQEFTCDESTNSNLIPKEISPNPKPVNQNTNTNQNTPPKNQSQTNQNNVTINSNNNQDEDNEDEDTGNENETEDTGNLISKIKTLFSTPAEKDGNTPAVVINKNVIDKKENSISGNAVSDSTSSGDTITIKKTTYYALLLYIPFLIELAMLIGLLVFDSYKRREEVRKEEDKDKKPQNKPNKRLLKKDTKSFTSKIKEIKKLIRR